MSDPRSLREAGDRAQQEFYLDSNGVYRARPAATITNQELGEQSKSSSASGLALLVLAFLALAAGAGLLVLLKSPGERQPESTAALSPPAILPEDPDQQRALARETARAFLAARRWEDALVFVRSPARVEPFMRHHHGIRGNPMVPAGTTITALRRVETGETAPRYLGEARTPGGETLALEVVWTDRGFRIDWERFSAYGTAEWQDILDARPSDSVDLRVYLCRADEAEEGADADTPELWQRVVLEHPASPRRVAAWIRDPLVLRQAEDILKTRNRVALHLRLSFQKWNDDRYPIITFIHHEGWSR